MAKEEGLRAIERAINLSRGALYEGDVFSLLKPSPYVVRGFEFSPVDGAIDCSREYDTGQGYGGRLWDVQERPKLQAPSCFGLFDVKSSVGKVAGDQEFISTTEQKKLVAFYIGICAADPTFVELEPNYGQDPAALSAAEDDGREPSAVRPREREQQVNHTRVCCLPASAYGGLDQCGSPYRMPNWLLPEAIRRVRVCMIDNEQTYVNPWTGVSFPRWTPLLTRATSFLHPSATTAHFTAYRLVMDILTASHSLSSTPLDVELVGLQPRLADFRLNGAQIQQKISDTARSKGSALDRVGVARGEGEERHYYFSAFDRFVTLCSFSTPTPLTTW